MKQEKKLYSTNHATSWQSLNGITLGSSDSNTSGYAIFVEKKYAVRAMTTLTVQAQNRIYPFILAFKPQDFSSDGEDAVAIHRLDVDTHPAAIGVAKIATRSSGTHPKLLMPVLHPIATRRLGSNQGTWTSSPLHQRAWQFL